MLQSVRFQNFKVLRDTTLAVVLDQLRDAYPERFEALNQELGKWLPEFDRVLFDTPAPGQRSFALRTRAGGYKIAAHQLSDGTLMALAILTLAYLPVPPSIVCLEEPDHGIHPRLLRDVQDAIYRLCYPEKLGEKRAPVQVIATTHIGLQPAPGRNEESALPHCRRRAGARRRLGRLPTPRARAYGLARVSPMSALGACRPDFEPAHARAEQVSAQGCSGPGGALHRSAVPLRERPACE